MGVGRRDLNWSYNEKRHCKNNIVASVGSHIYPLRCFQSKHSPFINERRICCQPRSSTWDLGRKSPTLAHPDSFSHLPHCLEQTPPPPPTIRLGLWKCRCGIWAHLCSTEKESIQYLNLLKRDGFTIVIFFQPQQLHLKWHSTWIKYHISMCCSLRTLELYLCDSEVTWVPQERWKGKVSS